MAIRTHKVVVFQVKSDSIQKAKYTKDLVVVVMSTTNNKVLPLDVKIPRNTVTHLLFFHFLNFSKASHILSEKIKKFQNKTNNGKNKRTDRKGREHRPK